MSLDAAMDAARESFVDLVRTLSGLQSVSDGAPGMPRTTIGAWIVLGDLGQVRAYAAGGVYEATVNFIVTFGYRVNGAPDNAEAGVTQLVARFITACLLNRVGSVTGNAVTVTQNLNGDAQRLGEPIAVAMPSEYIRMAGQDIRAYPVGLPVTFRFGIGI